MRFNWLSLMGLRTSFAVEPGNFSREILLPRNCLGGDFKGLHFVVYVPSRLGRALCPERAEITKVTTVRVIKTNPTTPVVESRKSRCLPLLQPMSRSGGYAISHDIVNPVTAAAYSRLRSRSCHSPHFGRWLWQRFITAIGSYLFCWRSRLRDFSCASS